MEAFCAPTASLAPPLLSLLPWLQRGLETAHKMLTDQSVKWAWLSITSQHATARGGNSAGRTEGWQGRLHGGGGCEQAWTDE